MTPTTNTGAPMPKTGRPDKSRLKPWQIVAGGACLAMAAMVAPDPIISPTAWAAENIIVPDGPYAGQRWSAPLTPYISEPLDCLASHDPSNVVSVRKCAQSGFTGLGIAWLGTIVDKTPAQTLVVQPTVDAAKDFNREKLAPTIRQTRVLRRKVRKQSSRDGEGSTTLTKVFDGGFIDIAGANSAAGLRSKTVKNVFGDEIDEWPPDLDGQGDSSGAPSATSKASYTPPTVGRSWALLPTDGPKTRTTPWARRWSSLDGSAPGSASRASRNTVTSGATQNSRSRSPSTGTPAGNGTFGTMKASRRGRRPRSSGSRCRWPRRLPRRNSRPRKRPRGDKMKCRSSVSPFSLGDRTGGSGLSDCRPGGKWASVPRVPRSKAILHTTPTHHPGATRTYCSLYQFWGEQEGTGVQGAVTAGFSVPTWARRGIKAGTGGRGDFLGLPKKIAPPLTPPLLKKTCPEASAPRPPSRARRSSAPASSRRRN